MELIEKALAIAARAHEGQVRKDSDTPYIVHPFMVGRILEGYGFNEIVVAAGIVHDVLEDSTCTQAQLRKELGDGVVDIVVAVSEDKTLAWEERKQNYIEQVCHASQEAKAVSVADKIHNAQCLLRAYHEQGPSVWKKFNRGREQKIWFERSLYDHLKKVWDSPMLEAYAALIEELERTET